MKQLKDKLTDSLTLESLWLAHQRASRNKSHRSEVLKFNLNPMGNLLHMMDVIRAGQYKPSSYRSFWIDDPKRREIMALPYVDRIVHQWAVGEFYAPYYFPRFISDSYACIPGRGAHRAVDRVQGMMRQMRASNLDSYYIMKMDISKFFNNIDQQILFNIMERVIADSALVDLTHAFIFDNESDTGIPIGNYTSQIFANIYLHELDTFVKYELRIKNYVRYMDDFVLLVHGRASAKWLFGVLEDYLWGHLRLRLNPKSRYYPSRQGLDFAGYRIYEDYRLLRRRSKAKIKEIVHDFETGCDSQQRFVERTNAWHGHVRHADSYRYVTQRLGQYRDILPVVFSK